MQLNIHFTLDTMNKTLVIHKIPSDIDVFEIPYQINGRRYAHVCFVRTISFLNSNEKINSFETISWPSNLVEIQISNTDQSLSELVTLSNSKGVPKVLIEPVFEWVEDINDWHSSHTVYRFPKKTINNNLVVIRIFN